MDGMLSHGGEEGGKEAEDVIGCPCHPAVNKGRVAKRTSRYGPDQLVPFEDLAATAIYTARFPAFGVTRLRGIFQHLPAVVRRQTPQHHNEGLREYNAYKSHVSARYSPSNALNRGETSNVVDAFELTPQLSKDVTEEINKKGYRLFARWIAMVWTSKDSPEKTLWSAAAPDTYPTCEYHCLAPPGIAPVQSKCEKHYLLEVMITRCSRDVAIRGAAMNLWSDYSPTTKAKRVAVLIALVAVCAAVEPLKEKKPLYVAASPYAYQPLAYGYPGALPAAAGVPLVPSAYPGAAVYPGAIPPAFAVPGNTTERNSMSSEAAMTVPTPRVNTCLLDWMIQIRGRIPKVQDIRWISKNLVQDAIRIRQGASYWDMHIRQGASHRDLRIRQPNSHRDVRTCQGASHRDLHISQGDSHRNLHIRQVASHRELCINQGASHNDLRINQGISQWACQYAGTRPAEGPGAGPQIRNYNLGGTTLQVTTPAKPAPRVASSQLHILGDPAHDSSRQQTEVRHATNHLQKMKKQMTFVKKLTSDKNREPLRPNRNAYFKKKSPDNIDEINSKRICIDASTIEVQQEESRQSFMSLRTNLTSRNESSPKLSPYELRCLVCNCIRTIVGGEKNIKNENSLLSTAHNALPRNVGSTSRPIAQEQKAVGIARERGESLKNNLACDLLPSNRLYEGDQREGNRRTLRKHAEQRHRAARFSLLKIRSENGRGFNPVRLGWRRVSGEGLHSICTEGTCVRVSGPDWTQPPDDKAHVQEPTCSSQGYDSKHVQKGEGDLPSLTRDQTGGTSYALKNRKLDLEDGMISGDGGGGEEVEDVILLQTRGMVAKCPSRYGPDQLVPFEDLAATAIYTARFPAFGVTRLRGIFQHLPAVVRRQTPQHHNEGLREYNAYKSRQIHKFSPSIALNRGETSNLVDAFELTSQLSKDVAVLIALVAVCAAVEPLKEKKPLYVAASPYAYQPLAYGYPGALPAAAGVPLVPSAYPGAAVYPGAIPPAFAVPGVPYIH
ncbi:hypothetical protein PR048_014920 [Dryococelus australis]|uniref:Uncharacterized protein n=1 Tax=Dryococelus australis TaxID=614101 RepID=A0ABQ9HFI3_9NEOP|nr:hypothetical protein PR048_014920 [Dryococelus australis]